MAVEDFHPPQLPPFIAFKDPQKLKNLVVYSHKCCHGDMPRWCRIVFRGSLNVVWYGPYIKSLRSWDGSGGLSSTSTATIFIAFKDPQTQKSGGILT